MTTAGTRHPAGAAGRPLLDQHDRKDSAACWSRGPSPDIRRALLRQRPQAARRQLGDGVGQLGAHHRDDRDRATECSSSPSTTACSPTALIRCPSAPTAARAACRDGRSVPARLRAVQRGRLRSAAEGPARARVSPVRRARSGRMVRRWHSSRAAHRPGHRATSRSEPWTRTALRRTRPARSRIECSPGIRRRRRAKSDVRVRLKLSDVHWKSNMTDYFGQLQLRGSVRDHRPASTAPCRTSPPRASTRRFPRWRSATRQATRRSAATARSRRR